MKRKSVWLTFTVLVASLLLTVTAAAQSKVKVVIYVGLGTGTAPNQIKEQEAIKDRYNSTHDNIEIEFLIAPHDQAGERLQAMIAGNTAPQLVGPNGTSTISAYLDSWEDITPYIEKDKLDTSDFYGPVLEINKFPGKNVGLPLGIYPSFILYNKDIFDAAGVPYPPSDYDDKSWTMDELRKRAMLITLDKNGKNATQPDFDPNNIVQWGYDDSWVPMRGRLTMWGAPDVGRPTTADYKTATANSPEWLYGLTWYTNGILKDHFIPNAAALKTFESIGAGTPMDGGLLGMFYSFSWYLGEIREAYPKLTFELQLAPLPFNQKGQRIARMNADNFNIPAAAEHKQEAWEVMKWLTAPEQIADLCQIYGCIPARASVADKSKELLKQTYPGLDVDVIFKAIPYLDNPLSESWVPNYTRIEDTLDAAFNDISSGVSTDPKAVLDKANADVQKILDDYWATKK